MVRSLFLACVLSASAVAQSMPMQHDHSAMQHTDPAADMPGMQHDHVSMETQKDSQDMSSMQQKPTNADVQSLTYPMNEVQELEALEMRTGSHLPAPELLRDVMQRKTMSLADWLDLAEEHHPSLIEARAAVARSEQQARQLALPPNPIVGYSGEHIRGGNYHGGEQGGFLSQEIVLGRKLALRRDVKRAEGHANEYAVEIQRARIHNDVAQRFFDALAGQAQVTLSQRVLGMANDAEANAHELMRVGQADAADVMKAELAAEQAKMDFVQSQRTFLAAFTQLAATAGRVEISACPLDGKLVEPPQIDVKEVVQRDVEKSPAVQQAQAAVVVADAKLKLSRREPVPNLQVTAGEWYSGERVDGTNRAAGWMGFAQVGVQLPLWNRNQGNVGAAKAELSAAHAAVIRTQLQTRERAEPLAQQYEQARFAADRYLTQMLPRARRAYELEVTKYQQMGQTYAKVLEAQAMLYQLQMGYVRALHDQWSVAIALENFALDGALSAPATVNAADAVSGN